MTKPLTHKDTPAAHLYFGKVMHARLKPRAHRFSYNVFSLVIDIDRLDAASEQSILFSTNKANLISFQERDHGNRDGQDLRTYINRLMDDGVLPRPKRVLLWCNPRVLGYTFNPLSTYFCYDEYDKVYAIVYQVHNTFGQSHSYVATEDPNSTVQNGSIRHAAEKRFYVSPFLDMGLRYNFRINPPDDALKIRILEHDDEGPILAAMFSGTRKGLNLGNLLLGMAKTAGLTWKITAGIHYEALWLWLKGITIRPRPSPPRDVSYETPRSHIVAGE